MSRIPHKCEAFEGEFSIGKKRITANSYVKDHQKFQKIYSSIADIILGLKRDGEFLEVGAGGAFLASIIAKKASGVNITATDISPDMVRLGKEYINKQELGNRIEYIHSKGENINFPNKNFDMIYSSFSINYWKDPMAIIENLARHLKPGGVIFIMDFRRVWWVRLIPQFIWRDVPVILAGYTRKEIYQLFKKNGEKIPEVNHIYPFSLSITIRNNT